MTQRNIIFFATFIKNETYYHMKNFMLFMLITFFAGCNQIQKEVAETSTALTEKAENVPLELPNCFETGVVEVLLNNSAFSYVIYKGLSFGYEYEMLKMFCEDNNLELKIKILERSTEMIDSLEMGHGHIAASNYTVNASRLERINFSRPFFRTHQVLVQKLPENWRKITADDSKKQLIHDPLDLDSITVYVKRASSFEERLKNFSHENGININVVSSAPEETVEDLLEKVNTGEIQYTVADANTTSFYKAAYPDLDFDTPVSMNQNIAWAINKTQPDLKAKIDEWIDKNRGGLRFNMLNNRYFDLSKSGRKLIREGIAEVKEGKISPYDEIIKNEAEALKMDWLMLAALINQESKFDPKAKSWAGAIGLTQVLPSTAKDLGVKNPNQLYQPEISIKAGATYLKELVDYWQPIIKDDKEAMNFALASYNTGKGHVMDARRLAVKYGKNENVWSDNVEPMLLKKSNPKYFNDPVVKYGYCIGKEPVQYVSNINDFYEEFKNYTAEKAYYN
jgi:membrane-bound lytic murein transglycosylase F